MGRIIDRRRVMGTNLPYAYEIEYLQGDGNAYLDTSLTVLFLNNKHFQIDVLLPDNRTYVWGGTFYDGQLVFTMGAYRNDWGGDDRSITVPKNTKFSVIQTDENIVVNETLLPRTNRTRDINFFLFTRNPIETNTVFRGFIYLFKVWDNNQTYEELIPVVDKQGVPAMYDKVSGQLFYNQGTGQFIAGPRVRGGNNN